MRLQHRVGCHAQCRIYEWGSTIHFAVQVSLVSWPEKPLYHARKPTKINLASINRHLRARSNFYFAEHLLIAPCDLFLLLFQQYYVLLLFTLVLRLCLVTTQL